MNLYVTVRERERAKSLRPPIKGKKQNMLQKDKYDAWLDRRRRAESDFAFGFNDIKGKHSRKRPNPDTVAMLC